MDSSKHTLFECAAWEEARGSLVNQIGPVVSLEDLVGAILRSADNWLAFSNFAGEVMRMKEEAERAIERGRALPPAVNR